MSQPLPQASRPSDCAAQLRESEPAIRAPLPGPGRAPCSQEPPVKHPRRGAQGEGRGPRSGAGESRGAQFWSEEASEGSGGGGVRAKEGKERRGGRRKAEEKEGGERGGAARGRTGRTPGAGRPRASGRVCGAGAGPGGAGSRARSSEGAAGLARRAACSLLQPRLRAARLRSEGHAPAARRELLASPGLPAAAPKPGSGVARGPLQAWGCSPWSSATATWTARGSGRGSAPTKRSSRGPTSSSRSSSRTGRASSRRPRALSITETLIKPLEKFRKEQLGAVKEEKKKFDKETEKNYSLIDKHLNLSAKKKDSHLQEADIQVEQNRQHFYELSLEYVCKLQEIQERKKFEFVEPMLSFFQGMFTFYHQGHELAKDFNHYKMELQINIQNTRNRFEGTRSEVEELMNKIRQNPKDHKRASQFTAEGYLYVQEKRPAPFGSSWVKHYCMYRKAAKKFNIIPFEHRSGGKLGDGEAFFLKECTKRHTDSIDRRFCFDVEAADRPGVSLTMQAFSEEERKQWLEALGGKEALFHSFNRAIAPRPEGSAQLDKMGFTILRKCISAVETRGINDQGLYRVVGVSSKVQRLLSMLMDVKTCNEVDLENSIDWEVKTITSALKQYLRSLPEPLMTYELHGDFIVPAKSGSPESRVNAIHFLVHKLPEKNKEMLDILVKHLTNVSNHSKQNLMTVANLGVVFGPTLMRPQEETVAAIMDLKFQNIVVEILIENHEKIFRTLPDATFPEPVSLSASPPNAPPRQSKRQGQRTKRPIAVYNLCLELEGGDSPNPPKEDTPTGSLDSLSSSSPMAAAVHGLPGPDRDHLLTDGGGFVDWASIAIINRKARAVYPCEAEHSSELSFEIGAIFEDVQASREPGWLEGTLNGKRGLIPQNYVKLL
ncbi:rho GTPase-activating protein 10 isoform X4 [Manis javanica]|uniref:rho GTPase-activating protein 10 isoform X4 n=1 Tax=Manis javanica TaxID=9974 RepID=UPI003C6D8AA2